MDILKYFGLNNSDNPGFRIVWFIINILKIFNKF